MNWLFGFFTPAAPAVGAAGPRDAAAIAKLHGASFQRGWSEEEVEQLLLDRNVQGHRITRAGRLDGFVLSRIAADEAEILSIAVAPSSRGKGLAGKLLNHHLRVLAGRAVATVFLEVGEDNESARKLYRRAGFAEVGRRAGYYPHADGARAALVLRRDLA
ncbi:MAG: ribosomal protein S18-alanine N-acetyltransferase [Pseudorhodoplanes sp.]